MTSEVTFDKLPMLVFQTSEKVNRIEALMMQLIKPSEPTTQQQFGFGGLLEYLKKSGYEFSKSQLQKSTASGRIPCKKFNNRLVFDRAEIDAWIERNTVSVGDGTSALVLAKSANNKLKGVRV